MSPEQIRIAVAELHGWKQIQRASTRDQYRPASGLEGRKTDDDSDGPDDPIPDYLKDLNAVHKVFLSLPFEMRLHYTHHLMIVTKFQEQMTGCLTNLANATAAQRCEALLRAANLWKE